MVTSVGIYCVYLATLRCLLTIGSSNYIHITGLEITGPHLYNLMVQFINAIFLRS
jgi:hypothetical protein